MSSRIKGLTIEIDGNTTKLNDALKDTDKAISNTSRSLKDVNRLLKFDPSNTDLLKQKQKLLADAVGETKDRLQKLKDAQAQMDTAGVDKASDAYQALQREIEDTQTKLQSLKDEQRDFGSVASQQIASAGGTLQTVGQKATDAGKKITAGVTAPIMAAGAAVVKAYDEVDAGADIVATKTGATGDKLQDMQEIVNDLASSLPADFKEAGTAVGEVNTKFELTGDALKDTSAQFLKFSKITGQDVNSAIDGTQQAMAAFNLTADQAPAVLDLFADASQRTGADVGQLQSDLLANATGFRDLGLSITDSVNLLADMQKSGVESSDVLKGLTKAQQNAAKDGKSMSDELTTAFSSQADMIDVFGSKAGAKLWDAFQQGKISEEDFIATGATLDGTLGTVSKTFENTQGPADKWQETMNQLKVAGADLAQTIMPQLSAVIKDVSKKIEEAKNWWDGLSDSQKKTIVKILEVIAVIGPLITIFGGLAQGIGGIMLLAPQAAALCVGAGSVVAGVITTVQGLFAGLFIFLAANPVFLVAGIVALLVALYKKCKWFHDGVNKIVSGIGDAVQSRAEKERQRFDSFVEWTGKALGTVKSFFADAIDSITGWLAKLKFPHLSLTGKFNLKKLQVPKINVEWYAKAMSHPYLLDGSTIFGMQGGRLLGGGEAGQEVITSKKDYENRGHVTNNITIYEQPGEDTDALADKVAQKIVFKARRQGYALGG